MILIKSAYSNENIKLQIIHFSCDLVCLAQLNQIVLFDIKENEC